MLMMVRFKDLTQFQIIPFLTMELSKFTKFRNTLFESKHQNILENNYLKLKIFQKENGLDFVEFNLSMVTSNLQNYELFIWNFENYSRVFAFFNFNLFSSAEDQRVSTQFRKNTCSDKQQDKQSHERLEIIERKKRNHCLG